jgi:hypothetical protein
MLAPERMAIWSPTTVLAGTRPTKPFSETHKRLLKVHSPRGVRPENGSEAIGCAEILPYDGVQEHVSETVVIAIADAHRVTRALYLLSTLRRERIAKRSFGIDDPIPPYGERVVLVLI